MQINDAGKLLTRTMVRLVVTALEDKALLILDTDIRSLVFDGLSLVDFGACLARELPRSLSVYYALGGLMMAFQSCS